MLQAGLSFALGLVLVAAALLKLRDPAAARRGLETFGFSGRAAQALGLWSLIAAELALGVLVIARFEPAYWLAAGLMALLALVTVGAILRGAAGEPCGCFGAASRVGWTAVLRDLLLGAGFAVAGLLPVETLSTDQWLGLGLTLALAVCACLAAALAALAREVGLLRMRVGPSSALEIASEGPELGSRSDLIERIGVPVSGGLGVAVFTSEGCHVCQALEPAIASVAGHPLVSLATFDEVADAAAWSALDVPGSPYAVAIGEDRTVLAKGTFNNLAQLESVLGAAERRLDAAVRRGD